MARVLIVEDEPTERVILGSIVEGMGHEVYFASDGEQAFKTYMRMSIDVVVTDLLMPHVDGLEFIVALRTLFPDAPVIAVSGQGPELLAAAENKGACVALSKPVDPHELGEAIARAAPDSSILPLPKSKFAARGNYRPLDEFEFEHRGRVRCIPAGGAIAADQAGDGLARTTEPLWDIRVDGVSIGQVDANLDETKETVRKAATKLIDENLQRANLTPARAAAHLKRRKELGGARNKVGRVDPVSGGRGNKAFASSTTEVTGRSKESVNHAIQRAENIPSDVIELVQGTELDKGVELDALAQMDPDEQREAVAAVESGETLRKKPTPSEIWLDKLQNTYRQSTKKARKKFRGWVVDEYGDGFP